MMQPFRPYLLSVLLIGVCNLSASAQHGNTIRNRLQARLSGAHHIPTEPHCLPGGCVAESFSRSKAVWANYCRCDGCGCAAPQPGDTMPTQFVPHGMGQNIYFSGSGGNRDRNHRAPLPLPTKHVESPRVVQRVLRR